MNVNAGVGMRRLAWIAALIMLAACASTEHDRQTALLRDALECEEDADAQLQNAQGRTIPASGCSSSRRV